MPIQQTKKQSDLEKRLKLLRQQVYGKSEVQKVSKSATQLTYRSTDTPTHRSTDTLVKSDLSYLYQDLLKIGILASLAMGLQIGLFSLVQNHLLRLNSF